MGMRQRRTAILDSGVQRRQAFSWSLLTYGEHFQTTGQGRAAWSLVESMRRQGQESAETEVAGVHSTEHWRRESHPKDAQCAPPLYSSPVHTREETRPVWERNHQEGLVGTVPRCPHRAGSSACSHQPDRETFWTQKWENIKPRLSSILETQQVINARLEGLKLCPRNLTVFQNKVPKDYRSVNVVSTLERCNVLNIQI